MNKRFFYKTTAFIISCVLLLATDKSYIHSAGTISPAGNKITNYYRQPGGIGTIQYCTSQSSLAGYPYNSTEVGYEKFYSDSKVTFNSSLISRTGTSEPYTYAKRAPAIKLPVSCIESTQWVINYMNNRIDKNYPGYTEYPNYPGYKLATAMNNNVPLYAKDGKGNFYDINKYDISEIPNITNTSYTNLNESIYNIGDGILVVNTKDPSLFHAVAIIGKRSDNGNIIVLERDAGTTLLSDTDRGDTRWVMNTYTSVKAFADSLASSSFTPIVLELELDLPLAE